MQAFAVVVPVGWKHCHDDTGLQDPGNHAVDFFLFQGLQEALTNCVVVWIANATHAADCTVLAEQRDVLVRAYCTPRSE
jgi:hypothetical protein